MTPASQTKISTVAVMLNGEVRYHFAMMSVRQPGTVSKSLRTWATARAAKAAGERAYGKGR